MAEPATNHEEHSHSTDVHCADGPVDQGQAKPLSKNKQRKLRVREKKLRARVAARETERHRRKQREKLAAQQAGEEHVPRGVLRRQQRERLTAINSGQLAHDDTLNVCVDLQHATAQHSDASDKELSRLVKQLTNLYGFNRSAARPARVHITSCPTSSPFYQLCCQKTTGFGEFAWSLTDEPVGKLFSAEQLVYLSPDAEQELTKVDSKHVYVICGIVDETVRPGLSLNLAQQQPSATVARLPLSVLAPDSNPSPSPAASDNGHGRVGKKIRRLSCVLCVNQVFAALLTAFNNNNDWRTALTSSIPTRKLRLLRF